MVEQITPVYVGIERCKGNLAVPLPSNLHLGLFQERYGHKTDPGHLPNIFSSKDEGRVLVKAEQGFNLVETDNEVLHVLYSANPYNYGNVHPLVKELPDGVINRKGDIDVTRLDELFAFPRQLVMITVSLPGESKPRTVQYTLFYETIGNELFNVKAKYRNYEKRPIVNIDTSHKLALNNLTDGYSGILSGSEEEILAKEIGGQATMEEIVNKLLLEIEKKLVNTSK